MLLFRSLGWFYLIFYGAIIIGGVRDSWKRQEPPLRILIDLALSVMLMAGCCFLLLGVESEGLRSTWRFVAPVLALGAVVLSVIEVRELDRTPERGFSPREHYWLLLVGSAIGILTMVPAVLANLVYAFAPHLWPAA